MLLDQERRNNDQGGPKQPDPAYFHVLPHDESTDDTEGRVKAWKIVVGIVLAVDEME